MPKAHPLDRFDLATDNLILRVIGASYGEVGTGKTQFWLSAPGPVVIFSFDRGLEGVVEPFVKDGKEIRVREYEWSPTGDLEQQEAIDLRDGFIDDFEFALQHARTVLIDKETDLWELFRYAEFGGPSEAPRNYQSLNQRYRKLINMPKSTDVNFGLIQGMKNEWVTRNKAEGGTKGVPTGNRIRHGFDELPGLVHVDLFHRREAGQFYIDVGKSRGPGSGDVQDQTFEGFTFVDLAQAIFPETSPEDWS